MAGNGFYGEYLDTLGIEYETTALSVRYVSDNLLPRLYAEYGSIGRQVQLTRDASIEFKAYSFPGMRTALSVNAHTPEIRKISNMRTDGSGTVFGSEFFTLPTHYSAFPMVVYPLMNLLQSHGDFVSDRAAIHYHVGFVNNLRLLKNLLRISLNIDPVLFRLGGMGRAFRGRINQAAYARPLLNSTAMHLHRGTRKNDGDYPPELLEQMHGSQMVPVQEIKKYLAENQGNYVQAINPYAALEARTLAEFWASFGVKHIPSGGSNKYHPARYCGINFYAIPQHGTIEFRHFNQTLSPRLIVAIGRFLRSMVELSTSIGKHETNVFDITPINEEISMSDAVDIVMKIVAMCHDRDVEDVPTDSDVSLILETISQSSAQPVSEIPVMTHLKDIILPAETATMGRLKTFKNVLNANHVDIHNISYQSIFDDER